MRHNRSTEVALQKMGCISDLGPHTEVGRIWKTHIWVTWAKSLIWTAFACSVNVVFVDWVEFYRHSSHILSLCVTSTLRGSISSSELHRACGSRKAGESATFRPSWFPCWFRVGAWCKVRHIDIGSLASCGWGQVPSSSTVPLTHRLEQDLGGRGPHQSHGRHILAACYTTGWEIFFILPGMSPTWCWDFVTWVNISKQR